jgi:hypothetical protein
VAVDQGIYEPEGVGSGQDDIMWVFLISGLFLVVIGGRMAWGQRLMLFGAGGGSVAMIYGLLKILWHILTR